MTPAPPRRLVLQRAAGLCLGCLTGHAALAQPASPPAASRVVAHGAFRSLIQRRDFSPKVELSRLRADGVTDAVGVLSALRGEVTVIDGREVVSLGPCEGCGPVPDTAALLVATRVARWCSRRRRLA